MRRRCFCGARRPEPAWQCASGTLILVLEAANSNLHHSPSVVILHDRQVFRPPGCSHD